jgi:hypothetical protein
MRILIVGDVHGNTRFIRSYIYPVAKAAEADVILQVGDYGFWEHTAEGIGFNDAVHDCAMEYGIPWHFIRGNHDNIGLLVEKYHTEENRTDDGFFRVRTNLLHIPDGAHWTWGGVTLAAFGGAYSIDKDYRLNLEKDRERKAWQRESARRAAGQEPHEVRSFEHTLWFPGEELSDDEVTELLRDMPCTADVVLSHDKLPYVGPAGIKDIAECLPNQRRLQTVLRALRPKLWFHGHLHERYTASTPCTEALDGPWTSVIGLACDDEAAPRFWRPEHSWIVLDCNSSAEVPMRVLDASDPLIARAVAALDG